MTNGNDKKVSNEKKEMEVKQNFRRIPVGEYLKLKKNSLILYIYLQQKSNWTEGEPHRYIRMEDINKTDMSRQTGLGRTTVLSKFKSLEELGLIKYWDKTEHGEVVDSYLLLPNIGDYYVLINTKLKFVKAILDMCDEALLRVFLFHKSYGRGSRREYQVTLEYIAECIGYSKTNLDKIIKANRILEGLEVISMRKVTKVVGESVKNYIYYRCNATGK